jgi:hypothetical protein
MISFRVSIILLFISVCGASVSLAAEAKHEAKVDPDVEKELKAAGFSDITGTWKKVKPNVYEVTDGGLEAKRTNGTLSVTVGPDIKGTLEVLVRNGHEEKNYQMMGTNNMVTTIHAYTGYGVSITDGKCDVYAPKMVAKNTYVPFKSTYVTLAKTDKTKIEVSVQDSQLKVHVNEKQPASANYKIDQSGPFSIIVKGTMQIESPSAKD